jgi:uncharacterized membrane protein
MPGVKEKRAFELDALRGLALFMMILHHLIFDLRYVFGLPVFAFQESEWFHVLLRPIFLNVFLIVSGICCTFSKNNTKRGLRLLMIAVLFSLVSTLISYLTPFDLAVYFNVLHLLGVGILLYALLTLSERRLGRQTKRTDVALLLLASIIIWAAAHLPDTVEGHAWLLPFGLAPDNLAMSDYLPIIPWMGFFLVGTLIGRRVYFHQATAFPKAPGWLIDASSPFSYMGRHSLVIYVIHQPILIGTLFGLRTIGLI